MSKRRYTAIDTLRGHCLILQSVRRGHGSLSGGVRTSLAVIGDAEHETQQTLRLASLLQQHVGVARQPQEDAERHQRVRRDRRQHRRAACSLLVT